MKQSDFDSLRQAYLGLWDALAAQFPTIVPDGPPTINNLADLNGFVGPEVVLAPGTYDGRLILTRTQPLSIRAEGVSITSPSNQPALQITGSNITIWGGDYRCAQPTDTIMLVGSSTETDLTKQPNNVYLINPKVLGHPVNGQKRGVSLHGSNVKLVNATVTDIKAAGQDSQAVWINNGPGPYTIEDCLLEGAGENLLTGGDDPRIVNCVPSDILIKNTTIRKPVEWRGSPWQIKNLLELKNSRRVTIDNCLLENCWPQAQTGYAIVLTVRNQGGNAPWSTVEDVMIKNSIIREVSSAISIHGDDDLKPSQRSSGLVFQDNRIVVSAARWGGDGRVAMIGRAPQAIRFQNNTCISDGSSTFYTYQGGPITQSLGCSWIDNKFQHTVNKYGFFGVGAGNAKDVLSMFYPGAVFSGNTIGGGWASYYPVGQTFITNVEFLAQFG